jgi:hypothetical protein
MNMKCVAVAMLFLSFGVRSWGLPAAHDEKAQTKEILAKCIANLGGLDQLRDAKALSYESLSHMFLHSVSVEDSLPAVFAYETNQVAIDFPRQVVHENAHWQWTESGSANVSEVVISPDGGFVQRNDKKTPESADQFYAAVDLLAANPISALLSAWNSADARSSSSAGVHEVTFPQTIYGQRVATTLGIDKRSYTLKWISIRHSYSQDIYNAMWGDTVKQFTYSSWLLDASGLRLPTKWKVTTNGLEDGQVSLVNVKVNPSPAEPIPEIPAEFKNAFDGFLRVSADEFAKRNLGDDDHLAVADGITMLPGKERAYNALVVKQDKGVVIVEGPYSNANSEQIIRYVNRTFPHTPITAVVSTDQFWFHIAGLPAYSVARIPIYVLDSNANLVRQLLATQASPPDSHSSAVRLGIVKDRVELGTGTNRMVLLPFRGGASAKMMAVYFPERKLLYASDLYLPMAWGHQYWTENLSEIRDFIQREHLDVQQVVGVSVPPHDWKALAAMIRVAAPRESAPIK